MWRPKQKSLAEASGVATPKPRLSREEKGKMPVCSNNAADYEVTTAIIPSPNSRAAMPCATLVHKSKATVSQHTHWAYDREGRAKVLSKVNPLRSDITGEAPQRAPLSSSSNTKLAPVGEARAEALPSANPSCRDKRSKTLPYVRSKKASTRDCLRPNEPDLREFLASKRNPKSFRTTSPYCQQKGCQLVTIHSARFRF